VLILLKYRATQFHFRLSFSWRSKSKSSSSSSTKRTVRAKSVWTRC